jgi:CRP-like cAMP-binding protein
VNSLPDVLRQIVRKFETRVLISDADETALLGLPFQTRTVEQGRYLVREGERPTSATLILSGLAYRHKVTPEGSRQIVSVHIPGDFVDLEGTLLTIADDNVQALTRCDVAAVPREAIINLIDTHPRLARAMWIDTLIDASIFREWIVNVGRRNARAGMCHLLCEFARRLEAAGLASSAGYELPMTQDQLADALGLTSVHVNRVLRELDREGLIARDSRTIRIPNWESLRKVAGFNDLYLHLDQGRVTHAYARTVKTDEEIRQAMPTRQIT